MTKVLLIEDEESLSHFLAEELRFEGYDVQIKRDGTEAWNYWQQNSTVFDVILLDWMLPGMDGMTLLRHIRRQSDVPVIFMTARDFVSDKVMGLDNGADDYLTKPFEVEELFARIRLVLRRQQKTVEERLQVGAMVLDTKSHEVTTGDESISLTARESALLAFFMRHVDEALTRDDLLDNVWQDNFDLQPNVVDVYVRYLRQKVPEAAGVKLETVRSVGYRLRVTSDE